MIAATKRVLFVTTGILSLVTGVVGAFLPLIPTVPLVLLSAFCFARSSERLHLWLTNHPRLGTIVSNFESGRGIARPIKIRAIATIWASLILSALIVQRPLLVMMLFCIGTGVSCYLWLQPECEDRGPA